MTIHASSPLDLAAALGERLTGAVIAPGHPGYESARRVWNGMIDRRPALIARCADARDVAAAVRFAAQHDLRIAVRGGGHNVAGTAVVDDGLVIDLSPMRGVRVDAAAARCTCRVARRGRTSTASPRRSDSPCRAGSCPRPAWPAWRSAAGCPTSAGATG